MIDILQISHLKEELHLVRCPVHSSVMICGQFTFTHFHLFMMDTLILRLTEPRSGETIDRRERAGGNIERRATEKSERA